MSSIQQTKAAFACGGKPLLSCKGLSLFFLAFAECFHERCCPQSLNEPFDLVTNADCSAHNRQMVHYKPEQSDVLEASTYNIYVDALLDIYDSLIGPLCIFDLF